MAVYVDNARNRYRNMIMCHMIADSTEELIKMCSIIGVNPKWLQYKGLRKEHIDICYTKRVLAIKNGAIEISSKDLIIKLNQNNG